MKASRDTTTAAVGKFLEGAKQGLLTGYAAPVVIIATGQLLLGNPLSAVGTVATAATFMNPVASTCAAVGAIWFGWKALGPDEQQAVLEKLSSGFKLSVALVQSVVNGALDLLKSMLGSKQLLKMKAVLSEAASELGRSVYAITRSVKDFIFSPDEVGDPAWQHRNDVLMSVLAEMDSAHELRNLLSHLNSSSGKRADGMTRGDLQGAIARELASAAAFSLPFARVPSYDDVVRMVARKLRLPTRAELPTESLERAILFKVIERALDNMKAEDRAKLTAEVQQSLKDRGVHRQVTYDEVLGFVKFTAVDLGGSVGTLAMGASGMAGLVGLNVLQLIVLKGIVITSGYLAATTAMLGLGLGGMLLAAAGAIGPIGALLLLLYSAYSLVGPAFRKLIPAICVIAAKRVEIDAGEALMRPAEQHGLDAR
jgi:uncharacterized protein YaaW (UPF0174 family)